MEMRGFPKDFSSFQHGFPQPLENSCGKPKAAGIMLIF
jgi:hypothetical protein